MQEQTLCSVVHLVGFSSREITRDEAISCEVQACIVGCGSACKGALVCEYASTVDVKASQNDSAHVGCDGDGLLGTMVGYWHLWTGVVERDVGSGNPMRR